MAITSRCDPNPFSEPPRMRACPREAPMWLKALSLVAVLFFAV